LSDNACDCEVLFAVAAACVCVCVCVASPAPTISFRKRAGSLPVGRHRLQHEGTELLIVNVQPSDEGDYECEASNVAGRAQEIIQIDVQGIHTTL